MDVNDRVLLLGAGPVHPDIEQLDGAVLARQAKRDRRETQTVTGFAAAAALGVGIIGGLAPMNDDSSTTMPFGPPVALTPLITLGRG
jgi:hypothetical protein